MNPVKLEISKKTLIEMYDEEIEALAAIDLPTQDIIIDFLFRLVENGGNKQKAAVEAGLGYKKKDDKERSREEIANCASATANRVLKNLKVANAYKIMIKRRLYNSCMQRCASKDYAIALLIHLAHLNLISAPNSAVRAIDLFSKIKGFYKDGMDIKEVLEAIKIVTPELPQPNKEEIEKLKKAGLIEKELEEVNETLSKKD